MKKIVISLIRRPDRKVSFQQNKLANFEYLEAIDGQQETFRKKRDVTVIKTPN